MNVAKLVVLLFVAMFGASPSAQVSSDKRVDELISRGALVGDGGKPIKEICRDNPALRCFLSEPADRLYALSTAKDTWTSHQGSAQVLGGRLATVRTTSMNEQFRLMGMGHGDWVWIGLNDRRQANAWEWDAGGGTGYTNWFAGEPNNRCQCREGKEEHVALHVLQGRWNDHLSYNEYGARFPAVYEFVIRP